MARLYQLRVFDHHIFRLNKYKKKNIVAKISVATLCIQRRDLCIAQSIGSAVIVQFLLFLKLECICLIDGARVVFRGDKGRTRPPSLPWSVIFSPSHQPQFSAIPFLHVSSIRFFLIHDEINRCVSLLKVSVELNELFTLIRTGQF